MAAILIVVTYLGGAAWGPQVSLQRFSSEPRCQHAKQSVLAMIDELNQSNLVTGASRRQIVAAECVRQ